jgi:threonine dehydratase
MNEAAVLPTIDDLRAAQKRIAEDVVRTPVLRSDVLDQAVKGRVFIKAECLQSTGAFKIRGAYNRLRQFSRAETRGGVVTWSSGNHGQAIAAAAKRLGMPAMILMPSDSVLTKVELTRSHGADVTFFNRETDDSNAIGRELAEKRGATIVPPANDRDVIAGQGTAALEMLNQIENLGGQPPDMLLVPCGSGGLTAGCALAFKDACPEAELFAVEPELFNDTGRSLAAGTRLSNIVRTGSICDALLAKIPAPLTFAVNSACGVKGLTISDEDALNAIRFAFRHLKVVLEPGGAAALAAVLSGKVSTEGKTVAVVCSGGNIDAALFAKAIAAPDHT